MSDLQHEPNHTIPLTQVLAQQFNSENDDTNDAFDYYQDNVNHFIRAFAHHYYSCANFKHMQVQQQPYQPPPMEASTNRIVMLQAIHHMYAMFKSVEVQSDLLAFYLHVRVMLKWQHDNQQDAIMTCHEHVVALLAQVHLLLQLVWQKMQPCLFKSSTMEHKWHKIKGLNICLLIYARMDLL